MKEFLAVLPLLFCVSIFVYAPLRSFLDTYLAQHDVAVSLVGEQRGYLYWYMTIASLTLVIVTFRQVTFVLFKQLVLPLFVFGVSGGISFLYVLLRLKPFPQKYVPIFEATPMAIALIVMGVFGMFLMSQSFRHNPEPQKAWGYLFLGFFLMVLAYIYLESLLLWTWGR